MTDYLEAADGNEVQAFQLLADSARAEATAESSWMARIAREALRPVRPTPAPKIGPADRSKTAEFVDDSDAVLFFACVCVTVRAGRKAGA